MNDGINDDAKELTELFIDVQLANVWEMLGALHLDEDALPIVGRACRLAYVRGYHDGCGRDILQGGPSDDDDEIDLRLVDVWADIFEANVIPRAVDEIVVGLLRCAYCRGALDGSGTRPFGPAPSDDPDGLRLPA